MTAYIQGNSQDLAAFLMVGDILQMPNRKYSFYTVCNIDYDTATIYLQPIDESGEPIKDAQIEKY